MYIDFIVLYIQHIIQWKDCCVFIRINDFFLFYGMQSANKCVENIEDAIRKAEEVYKTCEFLAVVKEKATCKSFGIE